MPFCFYGNSTSRWGGRTRTLPLHLPSGPGQQPLLWLGSPLPPFPARCSPWQPFLQTRGAALQQHLVLGEPGSPGAGSGAGGETGWAVYPPSPTGHYHLLCPGTILLIRLSEIPSATSTGDVRAKEERERAVKDLHTVALNKCFLAKAAIALALLLHPGLS